MRFLIIAAVLVAFLVTLGCTDPEHATKILTVDGYTEVEMTGYNFFACGKGDFFHTGFRAVKSNQIIEGTVCRGLFFKGSTIRFD